MRKKHARRRGNCHNWHLLRILKLLDRERDCDASLKPRGCEETKLHDIGDNPKSTHCPRKDFFTGEKHAKKSEGGENMQPGKDRKYP